MTNLEKYDRLFLTAFRVKPEELPGLKYRGIPLWDSLGHMDLMGDMEETFKISIGTADVLDFSSYEKGKEILAKYGVEMIGCDLEAIERGEDRKQFNECGGRSRWRRATAICWGRRGARWSSTPTIPGGRWSGWRRWGGRRNGSS